jgi:2-dehydro-3-deoxyphosphogluconate aldolase/(4S)-4-hydroxy-2-oxoglutarate aldolase
MRKELQRIADNPIIAVIRNVPEEKALKVMEALLLGGIKIMEVTFGSPNMEGVIKKAREDFGDDVLVGAGTVLTEKHVNNAVFAGAQFIFSPNFDEKVVKLTLEHDILSIPGVMTPTEIYKAYETGAHAVKIFPANVVGPGFIKDIKGPMPFIDIIPTGAIHKDNITSFFEAGALAVGMGGSLVDKRLILEENYKQLTQNARELVSKVEGNKDV